MWELQGAILQEVTKCSDSSGQRGQLGFDQTCYY